MVDLSETKTEYIELCRRLCAIMTLLELRDFIEAVEDVSKTGNGYGQIIVDMEDRRIKLVRATSSRKPGVRL